MIESDSEILASRIHFNQEENLHINGEMQTFLTAKCPWYDSEGNAIGIIGISRDISDRKAIEAALQESNILFENVIESTGDSIFVKDIQGRYLLVNSTVAGMIGKPKSEIFGKNDAELFPLEIANMLAENDRRIWQSGIEETIEELVKDSEGNILTFLSTKSPLRDRSGNITGVVGVARDISDRKQAEATLRRSEERLQLALWGSDSGMWDWNIVTDEMYCNHEYSALLGYEPDELQANAIGLSQLVYPDDLLVLNQKLNAYLENSENGYAVEHRMLAKSGEFKWILARGKVVERDENNAPVRMIGTISDIGDRKQAEKALQESEQKYRCLTEATSQIIWDTTASGEVVAEQTGWSAFTGATYDEIKGWGWLNNIHPDDREYTARMWSAAARRRVQVHERAGRTRIERRRQRSPVGWHPLRHYTEQNHRTTNARAKRIFAEHLRRRRLQHLRNRCLPRRRISLRWLEPSSRFSRRHQQRIRARQNPRRTFRSNYRNNIPAEFERLCRKRQHDLPRISRYF
ncbi:MAG: PAS domain S-box protein [Oscillatoriales cyanobacterium]|nr:MAG: PAS domain S-box protein [Oscillatoriales cyanobacterium]